MVGEVARFQEMLVLERARNDELSDEVKKAEEKLAELARARVLVLTEKQKVDAEVQALQDDKRILTDRISACHNSVNSSLNLLSASLQSHSRFSFHRIIFWKIILKATPIFPLRTFYLIKLVICGFLNFPVSVASSLIDSH